MKTKNIDNTYKTETILDMRVPKEALDFVKSLKTEQIIKLILLDCFEETNKHGGLSKVRYQINKYKKWLS